MKSLSEIDTISKRASRASGFDWGIAEEVGKNIRLLEIFGLPGIKNLNYYYRIRSKKKFEKIHLINKENKTINLDYCPIISGVGFLDQVRSLESFKEIIFKKIAFPLLFLPFVSRASEVIGRKLHLKIDDRSFILNYNNSIYSSSLNNGIINLGNTVSVEFLNNSDSFQESEWKELYKLSEDTFVEESDSLKQAGAGAGLTDND